MKPCKVLLVESSPIFASQIQNCLAKVGGFKVMGSVASQQAALESILFFRPDAVLLDGNLSGLPPHLFIPQLLQRYPVPVLLVSKAEAEVSLALQSGGADWIQKPDPGQQEQFFKQLPAKLKLASAANIGAKLALQRAAGQDFPPLQSVCPKTVVAIGASTGGTDAILAVVRGLPKNFPGIVAVQHMPEGFTAQYAQRISGHSRLEALEAREGMRLFPGRIILAAGGQHLRLHQGAEGYFVSSKPGEKISGHIPSVDAMFRSVANAAGSYGVGVLLTGMGSDGAAGLLAVRQAGGHTIAQNKETCAVYGMPKAAVQLEAVQKELALDEIAPYLVRLVSGQAGG